MQKRIYSKNAIIAICSLVYFVSYFSRKDFAAVTEGMLDAGVLEKSTAGLIGTALFICYGIGQLVSGYLADRIKPAYLMMLGLGVTAVANLSMPFITDPNFMILAWGVNGFAQAMLWPPIVRILSDSLDHERFVAANLVVTSAAHVSTILLYLYVPLCLSVWDWQPVFYTASALAAVAFAVLVVSLFLILPDGKKPVPSVKIPEQGSAAPEHSFFSILLRAGILPIFGAIIMMGYLRDGIESWLPTLYGDAFNRRPEESVLVSVLLPVFSIISITAVTALHKKKLFNNEVRGSAILFVACIAGSVPLALLIGVDSAACAVICLVLAAFVCACMHGCNFLLISCLPGRFAKVGRAATVSGLCNACVYVGAAVATYTIALLSSGGNWLPPIISWMVISALGVLLCLLAYKAYTSFIKSEN